VRLREKPGARALLVPKRRMLFIAGFFLLQGSVSLVTGGQQKLDTPMPPLTTQQQDVANMKAYLADKEGQDLADKQAHDLSTHQADAPNPVAGLASGVKDAVTNYGPSIVETAKVLNSMTPQGIIKDQAIEAIEHPAYAAGKAAGLLESAGHALKDTVHGAGDLANMALHPVQTYQDAQQLASDAKAAWGTGVPQAIAAKAGQLIKTTAEAMWNHPQQTLDVAKAAANEASKDGLIPCTGPKDTFAAGRACGKMVGEAAMWALPYTKIPLIAKTMQATKWVRRVGALSGMADSVNQRMDKLIDKLTPLTSP
jgi:hypothetical protein